MRQEGLVFAVLLAGALVVPTLPARADQAAGVAAYEAGDFARAFKEWKTAADGGDILAMRNLGQLYRWGKGTERDLVQAAHWYRQAADKGLEAAQLNLAFMHLDGHGVAADAAQAAHWFEKAAQQRNPVAQYQLARLLDEGRGVGRDGERALQLYRLAAQAGLEQAKQRLAELDPSVSARAAARASATKAAGDLPHMAVSVAADPGVPMTAGDAKPVEKDADKANAAKPEAKPVKTAAAKPEPRPAPKPVKAAEPKPEAKVDAPQEAKATEPSPPSVAAPEKPAAPPPAAKPVKSASPSKTAAAAPQAEPAGLAHIASYNDQKTAEAGWVLLQQQHPMLRGMTPRIVSAEVPGKGSFHRLYVIGDRAALNELCAALKAQSAYCMVSRRG